MNNLFIVTHRNDEFIKFVAEYVTLSDDVEYMKLETDGKSIHVFENQSQINDLNLIQAKINEITGEKILLFHGINLDINILQINVTSNGNDVAIDGSNRWYYEKLLNATDKFDAFDEVWDYFQNREKNKNLREIKTNFLDSITSNKKFPDSVPDKLKTPLVEEIIKKWKGKSYEAGNKDHQCIYAQLRDELNKLVSPQS